MKYLKLFLVALASCMFIWVCTPKAGVAQSLGGLLGGNSDNPLGGLLKELEQSPKDLDKGGETENPLGDLLKELDQTSPGTGQQGGGLNFLGGLGELLEGKQASLLGPLGRYVLGRTLSAQVLGEKIVVRPDDPRVIYLRNIALNLLLNSRYYGNYIEPVVALIEDDNVINAHAATGGFFIVYTGLLNFVKNEDELAFVLAHEIAHIELDHGLNAIIQAKGGAIASKMFGEDGFGDFFAYMENGYSKDIEAEADIRGAEIAAKTGYSYQAGIEVIGRLEKISTRKHGTGYPNDRAKNLQNGAHSFGAVSARSVQMRKSRFKSTIN